ncbi:hypothetical protein PVAND_003808 [Polypedilum vanderplanki]|uniref:Thioredoxin n=1 Tax=Polypedilum vanderplanki TaxID=319348 RepID=S6CDI3_POLVA|nr:hypothetical protein PVAND_003808 [Polypedilum vanderplanki]BAN67625.1 thioredoxin [Polypedilum vanderplanki]
MLRAIGKTTPLLMESILKKTLSLSACSPKRFVIKDHFDFDKKVINSDLPIIVNFHAEWCEPCKILTPKLTELLEDNPDIDLAIIDVDTNIDLVHLFEVSAVPSILAFRNGVVVDKFIGLVDANKIEELIEKLLRKKRI